jgi:hypothetical protein
MDKLTYGLGTTAILSVLLCYSWFIGKDGMVTTAILSLIGAISGTILGFTIAQSKTIE